MFDAIFELVNIILEYDGRIKYRNKKYINIIPKNDIRYKITNSIIEKKIEIYKDIEIDGSDFYFEFGFNTDNRVGLCYDYNWSRPHKFVICYYDLRNDEWIQKLTYL